MRSMLRLSLCVLLLGAFACTNSPTPTTTTPSTLPEIASRVDGLRTVCELRVKQLKDAKKGDVQAQRKYGDVQRAAAECITYLVTAIDDPPPEGRKLQQKHVEELEAKANEFIRWADEQVDKANVGATGPIPWADLLDVLLKHMRETDQAKKEAAEEDLERPEVQELGRRPQRNRRPPVSLEGMTTGSSRWSASGWGASPFGEWRVHWWRRGREGMLIVTGSEQPPNSGRGKSSCPGSAHCRLSPRPSCWSCAGLALTHPVADSTPTWISCWET